MPIDQRTKHLLEADDKLYRSGAFSSETGALSLMSGAAASCVSSLTARYGKAAILTHEVIGQDAQLGMPRIVHANSTSKVRGHVIALDQDNAPCLQTLVVVYPNFANQEQHPRMVMLDEDNARYLLPAEPAVFGFLQLMHEDSPIAQLPSSLTHTLEDTVVLEYIEDDEIVPPTSVFEVKDIVGFTICKISMEAHNWNDLTADVRVKWNDHFFDFQVNLTKWHNELFGTETLDGLN